MGVGILWSCGNLLHILNRVAGQRLPACGHPTLFMTGLWILLILVALAGWSFGTVDYHLNFWPTIQPLSHQPTNQPTNPLVPLSPCLSICHQLLSWRTLLNKVILRILWLLMEFCLFLSPWNGPKTSSEAKMKHCVVARWFRQVVLWVGVSEWKRSKDIKINAVAQI